jgi:hypothetical protein
VHCLTVAVHFCLLSCSCARACCFIAYCHLLLVHTVLDTFALAVGSFALASLLEVASVVSGSCATCSLESASFIELVCFKLYSSSV